MAPRSSQGSVERRQDTYGYDNCNYYYGDGYSCNSAWNVWGRWVALVVIVICALIVAFLLSRRRRRRGIAPMYGTGWMGGRPNNPPYGQQAPGYYAHDPYAGGAAAPPYSPPIKNNVTGNTFTSNEGYYGEHNYGAGPAYGGQQSGIELQPPQNAYQPQRGGDNVYEAPAGPPPGKGDGIIR